MATPAAARRNDLHAASKLESDLDTQRSTYAGHHVASRNSTPRPSISPLSTASRPAMPSPELNVNAASDDHAFETPDDHNNAADTPPADVDQDDDRSSSLSDVEDEDEDMDEEGGTTNLFARSSAAGALGPLEDDSEAETERLDLTPQKQRKVNDSAGKTSSKLVHSQIADDGLSDPPSPLPAEVGAASSTSTVAMTGQKRKRSDTADSPLTSEDEGDQSPRKRSHSSTADAQIQTDIETATLDAEEATIEEDTPMPPEIRDSALYTGAKSMKARKGKQKGKKQKEPVDEHDQEDIHESVEPTEEQNAEEAAKSAEELKQRNEALAMFQEVASQFVAFKEKMYDERLASLNAELQTLSHPQSTHPEYLRQVACVDGRLEKQTREAHAYYFYKLRSTRQRTVGERSQLHSQFFQYIREVRDTAIEALGEEWYNIQKERRQTHQEKDEYLYRFPTKKSAQIRQQSKYNQEVSVLSGVAKWVGFPAAPDIDGMGESGIEGDLRAMKIPRSVPNVTAQPQQSHRQQQAQQQQQHPNYQFKPPTLPQAPTSERLAHEQYLEQNAWARPQAAPIHAHGTPNLTHTPDWAEPSAGGPAKHIMRNLSGLQRTGSPYTTPLPQRRAQLEHSSSGTVAMNSDPAEPPSTVTAAPPTSNRVDMLLQNSSQPGSPLNMFKQRVQPNGERELTGFRNISNISGTSTIDAPLAHTEPSKATVEGLAYNERNPALSMKTTQHAVLHNEASAPQQAFETSQLHRLSGAASRQPEVYSQAPFRPPEGAFGTPTPSAMPASRAP